MAHYPRRAPAGNPSFIASLVDTVRDRALSWFLWYSLRDALLNSLNGFLSDLEGSRRRDLFIFVTCALLYAALPAPGLAAEEDPNAKVKRPALLKPDYSHTRITSLEQARSALATLREALRYHDYRYFQLNDPIIADGEYDELKRQIEDLEKRFPTLVSNNQASEDRGRAPSGNLDPITRQTPMLSLEKIRSAEEIRAFDAACRAKLGSHELEYIAEPKFDGLALELVYEQGRLALAATRGDGRTGENVTANVMTIREIPKELTLKEGEQAPQRLVLRGEIYMTKSAFAALNEERIKHAEQPFADPRNAAAGSLRQKDPSITAQRRLSFFAYEITEAMGRMLTTHGQALETLEAWGFKVALDTSRRCANADDLIAFSKDLALRRAKWDYEIDGVVFKLNRLDQRVAMGRRPESPCWAVAFKFPAQRATTLIETIEAQVGRTGNLTPVAVLDPVQLEGVEIRRASLHNFAHIQKFDIRIGDVVLIQRAGKVIPQVVRTIPERRADHVKPYTFPASCPSCGAAIQYSADYRQAKCPNISCPAQLVQCVLHFASREAMNIKGLGETMAKRLVESGRVKRFSDLYKLKREDLLALDGAGEKTAENLIAEIEASRQRELRYFIYGLGIPNVGAQTSISLCRTFRSLEALMQATATPGTPLERVGPRIAVEITAFFMNQAHRADIEEMLASGLKLPNPLASAPLEAVVAGKTFVITGKLRKWTREEIARLLASLGARVASVVNDKTDYLVVGEEPGSKLEEAGKRKLEILTEQELADLITPEKGLREEGK